MSKVFNVKGSLCCTLIKECQVFPRMMKRGGFVTWGRKSSPSVFVSITQTSPVAAPFLTCDPVRFRQDKQAETRLCPPHDMGVDGLPALPASSSLSCKRILGCDGRTDRVPQPQQGISIREDGEKEKKLTY